MSELPFDPLRKPDYPATEPRKFLSAKAKVALVQKQEGRCAICGEKPRAFEYDHVVELWASGTNGPENWQALCRACHADKSAAEAKHRAKMHRCRGKTGQRARREKRGGSSIKSAGFQKKPEGFKHNWPKRKL